MRGVLGALLVLCLGSPRSLWASGMTLHIWMAEKAAQEYVTQPELKELLDEQGAAWRNGAVFPDAGYAIKKPFGEYAHWHEFLNAYYAVFREQCPSLATEPCRRIFAHLLGVLAHDIGDVNFDRHFVTSVAAADQGGDIDKAQALTDPGCDFLAILEHQRGFRIPDLKLPEDTLLAAFERGGEVNVTREDLRRSAGIQKLALVGEPLGSPFTYLYYKSKMSWGAQNYYSARGGVEDTARRIGIAWDLLWESLAAPLQDKALFFSEGGWPNVDFYVNGHLLEDF